MLEFYDRTAEPNSRKTEREQSGRLVKSFADLRDLDDAVLSVYETDRAPFRVAA